MLFMAGESTRLTVSSHAARHRVLQFTSTGEPKFSTKRKFSTLLGVRLFSAFEFAALLARRKDQKTHSVSL